MKCTGCGAVVADATAKSCSYCGAVLPHEARAAERAAAAAALLVDAEGDGVPDALATLLEAQKAQAKEEEARAARRAERAALEKELELSRAILANLRTSGNLGCGAIVAIVPVLIVTAIWTFGTTSALEMDPWLGLHGQVFCPLVCDGCHGPYTVVSWTSHDGRTQSEHLGAYCRNPAIDLDALDRDAVRSRESELDPYDMPGGYFTMFVTTLPWFLLIGIPLGYLYMRRAKRQGLAETEAKVRRLEEELAARGE